MPFGLIEAWQSLGCAPLAPQIVSRFRLTLGSRSWRGPADEAQFLVEPIRYPIDQTCSEQEEAGERDVVQEAADQGWPNP